MATLRQQENGRWQAIVRRKGQPAQSKAFDTFQDAEKWANVIESEIARGVFVCRAEAERTTIEEALGRYLAEVTPRKRGAVQEGYKVKALMADKIAVKTLAGCRGADVAKYRDAEIKRQADSSLKRNSSMT